MHNRPLFSFTRHSFILLLIPGLIFLSYALTFAGQVIINPNEIKSPTFRTSTAFCLGDGANTHINLGFGPSLTGVLFEKREYCTVGGGYYNAASGDSSTIGGGQGNTARGLKSTIGGGSLNEAGGEYSTVGGGQINDASGPFSTIGGGSFNIAGGKHSWAGGSYMQLTSAAQHSFVWGYATAAQTITAANTFLIFPAGTPGMVGIGTTTPVEKLHICKRGDTLGAAVLLDSTGGANGRKFYVGSTLADNVGGAGLFQIYDATSSQPRLNINPAGNVGIGTTGPNYKLEVVGNAAKSSGGTTWINSSDRRLKDITGEYNRGLDAIACLRPVTFFYKEGNPRGLPSHEENIGFVAQEVQDLFPEAISKGEDGYLDFNMHPVNVALVNAVKELKAENDALRREIQQIKAALGL